MDVGLEFQSYQPALYSPPSPHLWTEAAAGAGPHPLSWKVAGPPPALNQTKSTTSSFRRADGPSPTAAGLLSASRHATTTPAHSKPLAAAATAAVLTSAAAAEVKGPRSAVLGSALAGYTSVITRTPISPSGYAVPVQSKQIPQQQQQQQQQAPGAGSIHVYGNPQLLSSTPERAQLSSGYNPIISSSSSAHHQACSPAAAAAAALAALSGGHARTSSAPAAGGSAAAAAAVPSGSYSQQYAARNYTPASVPTSSAGGRGSMLLWNIQQPPPGVALASGQHSAPIAGRRAATAAATAYDAGPSSSGSRPSSQESGSPGLMKLKQLSTARLVRRLGTPPAAQQDSSTSGGGFGARPAAAPAAAAGLGSTLQCSSSPAGYSRAAAASTQQPSWQQAQQQMQSLAVGCNPQQQQRQQQHPHAMQQQQQNRRPPQQQQQEQPLQQRQQQTSSRDASWKPQQSSTYRRSSSEGSSSMRNNAAHGSSTFSCPTRQPGPSIPSRGQQQQSSSSSSAGFSKQLQELPPDAQYVEVDRHPCPSCGRCFAPPALQQHVRICDKVFGQKRKAFDVKAQRLQGTGAAAVAQQHRRGNSAGKGSSTSGARQQPQRGGGPAHDKRPAVSAVQAKKPAWQKQSEQLRAAMRATKPQAAGASSWGGAAQLEEVEDSRVECPHCGRRFAELVAERHIPKCADIIAKPSRLKAAGGRAAYMRCNSGGSR